MLQKKTYKNWVELCIDMGWKTTGGTYKKARLKDLNTLCRHHKEGNKFVIDEIFEKKLTRVDGRSIYQDDINRLLIHECATSQNKSEFSIELYIDTLLLKLSMINQNFSACGNNLNQTSRYFKITIEDLKQYYYNSRKENKRRLESALNKLQRESYIKWERIYKINYQDSYRTAINEEVRIILTAERETLTEMRLTDKSKLYQEGKFKVFNDKVYEKIKDKMEVAYYFTVYKIIPSMQFEAIILEIGEKDDIEFQLNANICQAIEKLDNGSEDIKKFINVCVNRDCKLNLYEEVRLLSNEPYTRKERIIENTMKSEGMEYDLAKYLLESVQ